MFAFSLLLLTNTIFNAKTKSKTKSKTNKYINQ